MQKDIVNLTRKIKFHYHFEKFYECGIVLFGWEVKSIKKTGFDIVGSYLVFRNFECWLRKSVIFNNSDLQDKFLSIRDRKVLLKKKEIKYLFGVSKQKGCTLVPSRAYWQNNFIKLEICLCHGKKKYNKKNKIEKTYLDFDF